MSNTANDYNENSNNRDHLLMAYILLVRVLLPDGIGTTTQQWAGKGVMTHFVYPVQVLIIGIAKLLGFTGMA